MSDKPAEGSIGVWGGIALIVGITIGSGIFRTPGSIAQWVPDPKIVLSLWVLFGLVSLCGSLSVTELASMMPRSGGVYVYLRAAYGDGTAFVFGWLYLIVAGPAATGALATFSTELIAQFFPGSLEVGNLAARCVAAGLVVGLSLANLAGLTWGTTIQYVLTGAKLLTLLAVIVLAFGSGRGDWAHFGDSAPAKPEHVAGVMAAILFTYDGWVMVSLVAGEIRSPEKRMRTILAGGMLLITGLYLAANLAYFYVFSQAQIAGEPIVAAKLVGLIVGPWGATAIKVGVLCSVAGALNGNILARPHVTMTMAADGLVFRAFSRPFVAIGSQAVAAVVLIFALQSFDRLIGYFVATESLALLGCVAALFVLRRRRPDDPRPFRVPLYPWTPILFLAGMTAGLTILTAGEALQGKWHTVVGMAIVAAGYPVYWIWRRFSRAPS
jgi:amino acid transporter